MTVTTSELVDSRKLTLVWVALSMARKITTQSLNEFPENAQLVSLMKVLNVAYQLMDEILQDALAYEGEPSIRTDDCAELPM